MLVKWVVNIKVNRELIEVACRIISHYRIITTIRIHIVAKQIPVGINIHIRIQEPSPLGCVVVLVIHTYIIHDFVEFVKNICDINKKYIQTATTYIHK